MDLRFSCDYYVFAKCVLNRLHTEVALAGLIAELGIATPRRLNSSAMKNRQHFPPDLHVLILFPLVLIPVALLSQFALSVFCWLQHPPTQSSLWVLGIANGAAMLGAVLLFFAQFPQYRAGNFLRFGSRHLPPIHQRLYRAAFWIIVPSVIVLVTLLATVHEFQ